MGAVIMMKMVRGLLMVVKEKKEEREAKMVKGEMVAKEKREEKEAKMVKREMVVKEKKEERVAKMVKREMVVKEKKEEKEERDQVKKKPNEDVFGTQKKKLLENIDINDFSMSYF